MIQLFIAALFGLVIKLLMDIIGKFGWNLSGFKMSRWVNENFLRVAVAILLITAYGLYLSEGDTPTEAFIYALTGDYFLYSLTKPMGFKDTLPNVMKKLGAKPK